MPHADPEKRREYLKEYHQAHKPWRSDHRRELQRAWRAKNPGYSTNWYRNNKAKARSIALESKYGIGQEQFAQMVVDQRGLCAICNKPPTGKRTQLVVDHCHATGHVRALLCHKCNAAIGLLGDDSDRIHAAAAYLDSFNEY